MIKRCIMIFPKFKNLEIIEEVRQKYDPLFKYITPHITLVFPFDSEIETNDLKIHIENVTTKLEPFKLKMCGITGEINHFGNYLFLNVTEGENELIQLNNSLYTGILAEFRLEFMIKNGYTPHLTVGKLRENDVFTSAIEDTSSINDVFEAWIDLVSVEIIDDNDDSIIELEIPLN